MILRPEQCICSVTNEEIEPGTGMMFVKRDGSVYWFKDSKSRTVQSVIMFSRQISIESFFSVESYYNFI